MALATTVTKQFDNGQSLEVIGNFTLSGNYPASGDAVTWTGLGIKSTRAPLFVSAVGKAGYVYMYDVAAGKLWTYTSGTNAQDALAELSAGAYPAGATGDTITYRAVFPKNI